MSSIDIHRQKAPSLKKFESELGRQVANKLLPWINALSCYRKPKIRHLAQKGKDRAPGEASSIGFGHKYLAKHSEASYDESNPGCEYTERNRDNLV